MRTGGILGGVAVLLVLISVVLASGQAEKTCWKDRETIYICGDGGFIADNGVVAGCGTKENPYIIEGWRITAQRADFAINITQTARYFVIRNCVLKDALSAGIHFNTVANGVIEGCQLLRNERGILIENAYYNIITGNLISDNCCGVEMILGSKGNVVTQNSFILNGRGGYDPARRNLWYCNGIGNYWSDYKGVDRDCDRVGDEPYYSSIIDPYPLMVSPLECEFPLTSLPAPQCVPSTEVAISGAACLPQCGPVVEVCPDQVPSCASPVVVSSAACTPKCEPVVEACADQVLSCSRSEVTLTATVCPSQPSCSPCAVEWTKVGEGVVGNTLSITVIEPGTYTATITGADGCCVSDSVIVAADFESPVVSAVADQLLSCAVTEVELAAQVSGGRPPYSITWTGPGGGVIGCTPCITVREPGTYTVTVTGANGCATSDCVVVDEDVGPPTVNATVDGLLTCALTKVNLSANVSGGKPPYTVLWTKPGINVVGSTETITVSEAGTYTVTVTGANGCSASDSVTVDADVEPPVAKAAVDGLLTCAVTEVTLSASISRGRSPCVIEWRNPRGSVAGNTQVITVNEPGTYTVTATGANGCFASDSVIVAQDTEPPVVDAGPDQLLTREMSEVTLAAAITHCPTPYTVTWKDTLGDVVGQSESLTVSRPGIYRVTVVRDATGCSASDEVAVGSDTVKEVVLESDIEGLAVFGQLTLDGVPIPDSVFYFHVESTQTASTGVAATITLTDVYREGFEANGAEVYYIIPGNATVSFAIHKEQFIAGKQYQLLHLPTDPPGRAAVAFF